MRVACVAALNHFWSCTRSCGQRVTPMWTCPAHQSQALIRVASVLKRLVVVGTVPGSQRGPTGPGSLTTDARVQPALLPTVAEPCHRNQTKGEPCNTRRPRQGPRAVCTTRETRRDPEAVTPGSQCASPMARGTHTEVYTGVRRREALVHVDAQSLFPGNSGAWNHDLRSTW